MQHLYKSDTLLPLGKNKKKSYKQTLLAVMKFVYLLLAHLEKFNNFGITYGTGGLLELLNVSSDEKVLPTTYGELRPPLGKHRLKVCLDYILVTE